VSLIAAYVGQVSEEQLNSVSREGQVGQGARAEVIDHANREAAGDQGVDQVRPNEARSPDH
jgi:hypothetical protein